MSDRSITLENTKLGTLTVKGDMSAENYAAVIYSLSHDRGFDFVLQLVIGMVVDNDDFEAELDKINAMDEGEIDQYLSDLMDKELEPGPYSLRVELVDGIVAEVIPEPNEYTVKGMINLFFSTCTIHNAAAIVENGFDDADNA